MGEGFFYGLYFLAILFNYGMKLKLEGRGSKVERSNVREGIILGISLYLLYQVLVLPESDTYIKVIDVVIGVSAIAAGVVFFIKGRIGSNSQP